MSVPGAKLPMTTSTGSTTSSAPPAHQEDQGDAAIRYEGYKNESQLPAIMALVDRDLSEPYSIFTYRYFLTGWPELCIMAYTGVDQLVGVVIGKADAEGSNPKILRGYIAMLAVETTYRRAGIGKNLVKHAVEKMVGIGCDEVGLETEVTNTAALSLYERLGFAREERLLKYYLNGVDAFRLKLWLSHRKTLNLDDLIAEAEAEEEAERAAAEEEERRRQRTMNEGKDDAIGGRGGGKEPSSTASAAALLDAKLKVSDGEGGYEGTNSPYKHHNGR